MRRRKAECVCLGNIGQATVVERLRDLGLDACGTDHNHPFDVLCKGHDGHPIVGIEVKWLGPGVPGTRIDGDAIKRKKAWARENNLRAVYTAIVVDNNSVGWTLGLVNAHVLVFDYDVCEFAQELLEAGVRKIQDR